MHGRPNLSATRVKLPTVRQPWLSTAAPRPPPTPSSPSPPPPPPPRPPPPRPPRPPPPAVPDCGNPVASLRPTGPSTGTVAAGSYMADIIGRGRLRVGVSATNLLFSSVDPFTGEFEGFDIDVASAVAIALFGDASPEHIEFVVVPQ